MKYVALLSGGKDSCYNVLHCHKNGHHLVAAASLGPESGKEELDSYMYQTVGQDAIEFVAQALGVPLIRRVIQGTAIEQGSEYGEREAGSSEQNIIAGDETEDMYTLLAEVKSRFPEIEGVSVGAILSDYQRVRVEHVCRRLSLTPLCYLWQRDQEELLSEMVEAGLEAILIKVAGIGLRMAHLGRTLGEMQQTLTRLNSLYGLHVCGEGGEYETLTLDCPLFRDRINILETEPVALSDDKFATIAYLRIKKAVLQAKTPQSDFNISTPPLLSAPFTALAEDIEGACAESRFASYREHQLANVIPRVLSNPTAHRSGKWLALGNIAIPFTANDQISLEDEAHRCFSLLHDLLHKHALRFSNIAVMHVYLSDMADFSRINAIYATFFGTSPPARACVAVDLTPPSRVVLECIAYADTSLQDRKALHVQGLSYWAPANIGPYSQAITVEDHIFVSGQIGMIPKSLDLPEPRSLARETALASQHVQRIIDVLKKGSGGGWMGHSLLSIFWYSRIQDAYAVKACVDGDAPTLHVVVRQLPKGALVEKQVVYHTGNGPPAKDDGDAVNVREPSYSHGAVQLSQKRFSLDISCLGSSACVLMCGIIPLEWDAMVQEIKERLRDSDITTSAVAARWFYTRKEGVPPASVFPTLFGEDVPALTYIPTRYILSRGSDIWDFALISQHISGL